MKIIFTIILLGTSFKGICSEFDTLSVFFSQFETLAEFKQCLAKPIHDLTIKNKPEALKRNLDFNFEQSVYELKFNGYEPNNFTVYLLSRNDSIVLGFIEEIDYFEDKVIKSKLFKRVDKEIISYINQHLFYYEREYSTKEFISEMRTMVTYGFACALGRNYFPPGAIKMEKYIANNNYRKLSEMLRSINPELQAYGITGLQQLRKKGVEIKSDELKIINHLTERNIEINTCYGCRFGRTENLIEALKWYDEMPAANR